MREKDKTILFLQALVAILVVLRHSYYLPIINENDLFFPFHQWVFTFNMPLCFLISGFLLQLTKGKNDTLITFSPFNFSFLRRKVFRLLMPYWLLSTIAFIPKALLPNNLSLRPLNFNISDYLYSQFMPMSNAIGPYWFIPTLFGVFVLAALLWKPLKSKFFLLIFPISIFLSIECGNYNNSFLCWKDVLFYFPFFLLGMLIAKYNILNSIKNNKTMALLSLAVSILIYRSEPFYGQKFLNALPGITFTIAIAKLYNQYELRLFDCLEGTTFSIYLLHWFIQIPLVKTMTYLGLEWYIQVPIATTFGIIIPILIHKHTKFNRIYKLDTLLNTSQQK